MTKPGTSSERISPFARPVNTAGTGSRSASTRDVRAAGAATMPSCGACRATSAHMDPSTIATRRVDHPRAGAACTDSAFEPDSGSGRELRVQQRRLDPEAPALRPYRRPCSTSLPNASFDDRGRSLAIAGIEIAKEQLHAFPPPRDVRSFSPRIVPLRPSIPKVQLFQMTSAWATPRVGAGGSTRPGGTSWSRVRVPVAERMPNLVMLPAKVLAAAP